MSRAWTSPHGLEPDVCGAAELGPGQANNLTCWRHVGDCGAGRASIARVKRRPIIAVIGVDGAGKSTQAQLLADWLSGQGTPASYFENAGGRPTINRLARRLGRRDGPDLFGAGYVGLESSVRWLAIARALLISRATGRIAIMDRYSYCQYAVMRARADPGERRARVAFSIFPTPDIVCLLAVPALVAQARVEQRGRDSEELGYLSAFAHAYRSLPEADTFQTIDASGSPAQVQAALREAVAPVLHLSAARR